MSGSPPAPWPSAAGWNPLSGRDVAQGGECAHYVICVFLAYCSSLWVSHTTLTLVHQRGPQAQHRASRIDHRHVLWSTARAVELSNIRCMWSTNELTKPTRGSLSPSGSVYTSGKPMPTPCRPGAPLTAPLRPS